MAPDEKSILQFVPEPYEIRHEGHPGIPEEVQAAWKATYGRELRRLMAGQDGEPGSAHHQAALVKANSEHLNFDHPETYEEALALPKWKYLVPPHEEPERDGNGNLTGRKLLRGMTIHGHALRGPKGRKGIPVPVQKPAPQKPEGAKPEGAKPEGAKPEGAKPEGAKPEGGKPEEKK